MEEFMGQPRFAHGVSNGNGMDSNGDGAHAPSNGVHAPTSENGVEGKRSRGLEDSPSGVGPSAAAGDAAGDGKRETYRDRLGRFLPNNQGGAGNPFGRQVAEFRRIMLACVTPEDIEMLMGKLLEMAKDGNLGAMKTLLSYVVGKPAAAQSPDRVEHEEWEMRREQPHTDEFEDQAAYRYPHNLANVLHRGFDVGKCTQFGGVFEAEEAKFEAKKEKQRQRDERRQQRKEERSQREEG